MRYKVDRFEKGLADKLDVRSAATATGRAAYSAATGSTQPLKMSAQAVSSKRSHADFERGRARRGRRCDSPN